MKLIKTKHKGVEYTLCERWPVEIKKDTLHFFIKGLGWLKTKKFERLADELPDLAGNKSINWLQIARYYDAYGIHVAEQYAECLTAGIVARQTANGYGLLYQKAKALITEDFDPEFFAMLKCDYMLACFGMYLLDTIRLDETLGKLDPEYSPDACLYKGEVCSMNQYVEKKYGKLYVEVIESMLAK